VQKTNEAGRVWVIADDPRISPDIVALDMETKLFYHRDRDILAEVIVEITGRGELYFGWHCVSVRSVRAAIS